MADDLEREDLGLRVGCNQALRAGEVVTPWDDVVGHYDCHNPTSLERIPDLDSDPDCPPPFVLLGNPARYVALDVVRATLGDTSNGPEAADEIARLRAENEALKRELASRPQWAGGQSPITCGSGGVGFCAVQPTSEGHAAVLADLARRIDDE